MNIEQTNKELMEQSYKELTKTLVSLGIDGEVFEHVLKNVHLISHIKHREGYDHGYQDGAYSTKAMLYWKEHFKVEDKVICTL